MVIAGSVGGLAMATSPGCGQAQTVDSTVTGNSAPEAVGQAKQAVVSAETCTSIRRQGSAGTVYDATIKDGLDPNHPNGNFGSAQNLATGPTGGIERDALIEFDLSSIPSGPNTNVLNSNIFLARATPAPTGPGTIEVHQVLAAWNESTVSWNNFGGAYSPTILASFSNQTSAFGFSIESTVIGWVQGTIPNYGILLLDQGPNSTNFWSSEYGVVGDRPQLNVCYTVSCSPGLADCDNSAADGCEVNTTTDPNNCGGCGDACVVPNAAPACVNSACAVGSCNNGFADCDGLVPDGCETSTTTNANCGGCGIVCALPNATTSCSTGSCALVSCNAGWYDCDGNAANGCEANICNPGQQCTANAQCTSDICSNGSCTSPSCMDGVQNEGETGVDCGGPNCPACGTGGGCNGASDCASLVCTAGTCQAATCSDGVQNEGETSVDCGGPNCAPCGTGGGCTLGSDCTSGVCTANVCQAPTCNDGVKNGSETGVDCGGGTCAPCPDGTGCVTGSDCVDKVCANGVCQMASCTDGVQNGNETDVDCGGSCPACGNAAMCNTNADCGSGFCSNHVCTPIICSQNTCGLGVCQVSVTECNNTAFVPCVPGQPTSAQDLCDGMDENCDGVVNGPPCVCQNGDVQSCYTGSAGTLGVGVCHAGTQLCVAGQWAACTGEVTPTAEVCDGLDNDCNGQVDDGLGSTTCGGPGCTVTVQNCVGGVVQTCSPSRSNGNACNDGNPCTQSDTCTGGICAGTNSSAGTNCGSGVVCNGSGTCVAECFIGGVLYASGATNPSNQCQLCTPSVSTTAFSNKSSGTACNDGNACTSNDVCNGSGSCGGSTVAAGTSCGAGVVCNGTSCVAECYVGGTFYSPGAANPGNQCQQCAPGTSTTSFSNDASGTACNDGNPCTSGDVCNGAGSCGGSTVAAGTSCGSGLVCNGTSCVSECYVGGAFYSSGQANPGNQCQQCVPSSSTTSFSNDASGTACNDGNACTRTDTCNGSGTCVGSNPVVCTAEDACHTAGTCNTGTGVCSNPVAGDGIAQACGSATSISVGYNSSQSRSGWIVAGNIDYYLVSFTGEGTGTDFTPSIALSGTGYTMTVYGSSACSGVDSLGNGACSGVTEFQESYPGNQNSCTTYGECSTAIAQITQVWVAVTHNGSSTCTDYTITFAQGA